MDPDPYPDPAIFVIDLQDANKKRIFLKSLSGYYFLYRTHLDPAMSSSAPVVADPLVRIRIRRSVPLTNESGS